MMEYRITLGVLIFRKHKYVRIYQAIGAAPLNIFLKNKIYVGSASVPVRT